MNSRFSFDENPIIYPITDGTTTAENFIQKKKQILELVRTAVQTEISLIQIREKQLSARLVFDLVAEAAALTRNARTKLLVNDRADIALAANADGVHLTARSISARVIRKNFPDRFIVGVSAHSLEAVENARRQDADFAVFSPIFFSPDKGEPQGIATLRLVCQTVKPFPVIALGGIDETNYAEVLKTGANGFAAIRFLNDVEKLKQLTARLRSSIKQSK